MADKRQSVIRVSVSSAKCKLFSMVFVVFLDLVLSTFVEYSVSFKTLQDPVSEGVYIGMMGMQIFIRILLVMLFILLLWTTFVFRNGMVREIISNFKWTFLIIMVDLTVHFVERSLRILYGLSKGDVDIWKNAVYTSFYFAKHILQVFTYSAYFISSLKVTSPEFYKPENWIRSYN